MMLIEEARWLGQHIRYLESEEIFPMVDIGSSTEKYRTKMQPWIDEYIFEPLRNKRRTVKHLDIKKDPGVDIVGDLSEPAFLEEITKMGFRSVLCASLLEQVENREEICRAMVQSVPVGGYLFISCPYRYPYHPNPIDTMFRPTVEDLAGLFPGTGVHAADVIRSRMMLYYVVCSPFVLAKRVIHLMLPFYKPRIWSILVHEIPFLLQRPEATCLVLQRVT